jgi:hypothetical protein
VSSQVLCASTFNFNVNCNAFSISIHFEFSITFQLALALALISWSFFQQLNLDFLSDGQSRLVANPARLHLSSQLDPSWQVDSRLHQFYTEESKNEPWPCRLQDYQKRIIRL